MSQIFEAIEISSTSGAALNTYHQPANGKAIGVVQINHGLAEHAARYAAFAEQLSQAGFHVYAQDHRGHGATRADHAPLGQFAKHNGGAKVLADVAAIHHHIKTAHTGLPIIIFGHSMGGLIAMNYALAHGQTLAGAAIWNSNFSGGALGRLGQLLLKWEAMRLGSDAASRILPKLTFAAWGKAIKGHRTPFDWLSHKEAEVDAYIADPLCGWDASVGMWQTIFEWVFAGGQAKALAGLPKALPFHLVGGGQDPASDYAKAVRQQAIRLEKAGLSDVTLKIFDTSRHETLNDLDAELATRHLIDWAKQRCKG